MRPEPEAARTPVDHRGPGQAGHDEHGDEERETPAWIRESSEEPGPDRPGGSDDRPSGEGDLGGARILADVAALTAERDEYLSDLQRLKADFDNYRKRVQRLQEEQSARGVQDLVTKLLPVVDNLDLAQAHLGGDDGNEEGRALGQVRSQLLDVLAKEGLERVDRADVPFDPAVHDAVAHVATDGEGTGEVTVEEVMRAGYRWGGQTLRPAMVRVRG